MTEQINLSDERIEHYAALIDGTDERRWLFGAELASDVDALKAELKGKLSKAELRSAIGRIRAQAGGSKIDRSTASDWENVARFYAGAETEYPFSWSQYRALKSARAQWRELAEVITFQSQKFGGIMASPAVIRIFGKALKGDLLATLLARLEAAQEAAGAELTASDISDVWKALGVSDVPEWQVELGKLRDRADAVRVMQGVPQGVVDVLCELGDKLSEALSESGAEPEGEAGNDVQ
jgi:hypothetical protein